MSKLWAIEAYGQYGGGVAIVRAATEERARELAAGYRGGSTIWNVRYDRPDAVCELDSPDEGILHVYETGE